MNDGGISWVVAVNLIIWTGLFLYLLNIERKIRQRSPQRGAQNLEKDR